MEVSLCVPNVAALFLILTVQQSSVVQVSSVPEGLEKFVIQRRNYESDLFTLHFKNGFQCAKNHSDVGKWCGSLNARHHFESNNRGICSCTCQNEVFPTFLPEKQICVNSNGAANFGGCTGYFEKWLPNSERLLYRPFSLSVEKALDFKEVNADYCYLVSGHYFDYKGFQVKWESIPDQIFSFDNSGSKVKFQWKADTAGKLSGRIIRLNTTCNYSSDSGKLPDTRCMLFKASGSVTYYSSASSVVAVPSTPSPSAPSSISLPPLSKSPSPLLPESSPLSSSSSLSLTSASVSLVFTASPTGILPVFPSTRSLTGSLRNTGSTSLSSAPILSTSRTELQSSLPFHSEEASGQVFSTGIPNPVIPNPVISTMAPHPIEPSKSSLATEAASSTTAIDGPGNKKARPSGNDNGTVIGAAVGGAIVFTIFVIIIIIFCKRRKLREGKEKATKLQVKNPVYGSSDIPLSSATENQVTTSMDQDSQPTYQDLITDSGKINGATLYSSPDDDDYDNYSAYQSLDKEVPGSPVYQSLTKGQLTTGKPAPKPKPSATGPPSERPEVTAEPVYNVLEQHDTEQGSMPDKVNGVPEHDSHGDTQDPVYNVLEGSDAEENYEAPDVGDALYNVLEGPESKQDPQEPLYNVLESSDSEKSSHQGAHGSSGLSNEPLYNLLEGPGSDGPNKNGVGYAAPNGSSSPDAHDNPAYEQSLDFGPNKNGVGYAAPNGSSSPDAHDNPAYEQSLDFDVPYTSVHRPGSQGESVYEPLRGPDDQDLYEPLK